MFESCGTDEIESCLETILDHLQCESRHLDIVLENSLKMQTILQRKLNTTESRPHLQLALLRNELTLRFAPILAGRNTLRTTLRRFQTRPDEAVTISKLMAQVGEPYRSQLKERKKEIKTKLHSLQAMMMGHQAVLVYTLDFYQRLLAGITGETPAGQAYTASGYVAQPLTGSTLQTNC